MNDNNEYDEKMIAAAENVANFWRSKVDSKLCAEINKALAGADSNTGIASMLMVTAALIEAAATSHPFPEHSRDMGVVAASMLMGTSADAIATVRAAGEVLPDLVGGDVAKN